MSRSNGDLTAEKRFYFTLNTAKVGLHWVSYIYTLFFAVSMFFAGVVLSLVFVIEPSIRPFIPAELLLSVIIAAVFVILRVKISKFNMLDELDFIVYFGMSFIFWSFLLSNIALFVMGSQTSLLDSERIYLESILFTENGNSLSFLTVLIFSIFAVIFSLGLSEIMDSYISMRTKRRPLRLLPIVLIWLTIIVLSGFALAYMRFNSWVLLYLLNGTALSVSIKYLFFEKQLPDIRNRGSPLF